MLKIEDLKVVYDKEVLALENINLNVEDGEFVGIIGSSGSGKSTLIKCINLLVRPTEGKIYIDDVNIMDLDNKRLREIRKEIGFIFQDYNLIDRSTVVDNVLIGRLAYKSSLESLFRIFSKDDYERATNALNYVGLDEKVYDR